ncbi:UNVERIFIED_CONTAM: hypothetical protein PYX00_000172 [Menopon gallinae]|uniref:Protein kinase domain-containing protein n=1 Tax=Menopon gallinae TaxID=328185 RepID=A0AAW2I7H1_9NEOP
MGKSVIVVLFCIGICFWDLCSGLPIDFTSVGTGKLNAIWLTSSLLLAVGFLIGIVSLIIGCICCRNGGGFQEFSNSHGCLATPVIDGFVNPTASSEITIFPPFGVTSDASSRSSVVHFEPLPNIKPQSPNLRPAAFSYSEQDISSQDWFYNPYKNFPRNQLKYLQEYGKGWFGRVVEGEAQNIVPNEKVTKVIVKILHEDATPTDQMYFLHEVKFYRDLKHPNILGLLGRCLETEPFLILLESCPNGDLKSFLTQNMASAQALVEQGVTLRMLYNITSGLQYMHENKFIHTDLAARNCLVSPDLTVKIGDYGNSIEVFKSDYYCAGSVALPVRWCAPETLKCTDVTIETREVTPLANIWTLAVVFWEIVEFCKLPYEELNDDQVIVQVLGGKNYFLQMPKMSCLYKDELYHLMKLCWSPPLQRPTASQISVILANLLSSKNGTENEGIDPRRLSQDFEQRWQKSKPNYIPKTDNAADVEDVTLPKFKGAKVADSTYLDSPLGVFMLNKTKNPDSPRVCLKSEPTKGEKAVQLADTDKKSSNFEEDGCFEELKKSDSVTNLTGSLDRLNTMTEELQKKEFKADFDLNAGVSPQQITSEAKEPNPEIDSWLKGVEVNSEEDETFVRKISEAIRDLDAALAMEKTSSSEENSGKSSHQSSPGKETKEGEEIVVGDFKLGGDTTSFINVIPKSFELSSLQNSEEPQSINFTTTIPEKKSNFESYESPVAIGDPRSSLKFKNSLFDDSLKGNDSFVNVQSRNSSDTEDETWRRRIERGEFSEKVKEKSRSIANLMVLTHIDASDESDVDLEKSFDRSLTRNSYSRRHYAKSSLSSNNFGSENDLTNAVLEDNFKESLKKLSNDHKEYGRFDSLGMILPVDRQNVWGNILRKSNSEENLISAISSVPVESSLPSEMVTGPSDKEDTTKSRDNFLGNTASKKLGNDVDVNSQNSASLDNNKNNFKLDSASEFDDEQNCDNSEIGSACEIIVNGSSLSNDSCECIRLEKEDLSTGISAEESPLFSEDTILREEEKGGESPEIVPTFFGAVNQSAASSEKGGDDVERTNDELENVSAGILVKTIPEIEITEEVQEVVEDDFEKFELTVEKMRPFKFVLKEESPADVISVQKDELLADKPTVTIPGEVEVIIGACEDYTLDYFKGLKTTFGGVDSVPDKEVNLDVWDKHLEKSITQILDNTNFDDINFFGSSLESSVNGYSDMQVLASDNSVSTSPITSLSNVEDALKEKKGEDSMQSSGFTNLTGNASEEEYENGKLRTPDDERSSDSGFRDKGSLSESVEDTCEGKYNLEDIEAELEEAYVKGAFNNCEIEKKEAKSDNHFGYEETKFYEEENKDDLSDIDGEIEFWQNQETSDYYPEISEFNPVNSHGWYLHPPDENFFVSNDNVDEEFVNALRNELRQKLPVQSRNFHEFSEDHDSASYENPEEDKKFVTNFSVPLSPILEEGDAEQIYYPPPSVEDVGARRKTGTNFMETGKSVDTNAFIHYLDYMVETEGKDKNGERLFSQYCEENGLVPNKKTPLTDPKSGDILIVNMETNEVRLVDGSESKRTANGEVERGDLLDEGSPDDEGLIFTPESASPERDRSLSEPSRSSNGSRVGDVSSEMTISSPDILSECYLTPTSEKSPVLSPEHQKTEGNVDDKSHTDEFVTADSEVSQTANQQTSENTTYVSRAEGAYEMSTSFMGEVSDDEEADTTGKADGGYREDGLDVLSGNVNDWESSSGGEEEEASSSSGEFIWKLFQDPEWKKSEEQEPEPDLDCQNDTCEEGRDDEDANTDFSDSEDDPDCSSTGSSASITDFVPSAWNSKAMPSRPALRSPDKKSENQKRSVWFKKQKYHCIYEYPREPSDSESANNSPQKHFSYGIDSSDVSNKYFTYGINSKNLTNNYFAYGLSDLIDYSNYVDWEALDRVERDVISEDGTSDSGVKVVGGTSASDDRNFYNLNYFDYDFNNGEASDEFFVSSSARPFQGGSSQFFPSGSRYPIFKNSEGKTPMSEEPPGTTDFITPDSGVEDTTPQKKPEEDVANVLDNLKFSFIGRPGEGKPASDAFGEDSSSSNDMSIPSNNSPVSPLSPVALGELRHARNKLKLDLPLSHNIDLNMSLGKGVNNKVEELTQN